MNERTSTRRKLLSVVGILCLGAINLVLPLHIVPTFEKIFEDMLPGKPLPGITNFIISDRYALAALAGVWMVTATVAVGWRHRFANWIYYPGLLFFFTLVGFTVFALFIPMVCDITGMSPQGGLTRP